MNAKQIDHIARTVHEINRIYCAALGDHSQVSWDDAPEWQQETVRNGVRFLSGHPFAGPERSHENWYAVKESEGWQWGAEKDPDRKLHPCMVAHKDLSVAQQMKDYIFWAVVRGVLAS